MKKVIVILSDALCNEYIDEFNLINLKKIISNTTTQHIKKVYPSTGYCEIVEYVTGQEAEQHNMFTQINVKKDWINIRHPKFLDIIDFLYRKNFLRKIPKIRGVIRILFDRIIDKILLKYICKSSVNVKYNIPYSFLYYMKATESVYEYDSVDFGGDKNLFVNLKNKNINYDIDDFVKHNKIIGTDSERLERLENKIKHNLLKDFTLLYIGYGEIAHFTGKNHEKFKQEMQIYDKKIGDIYNVLNKNYKEYEFIILGDHGMIDINNYHDVQKILRKIIKKQYNHLKLFKDYIYFVDSTMFRLWFKDKSYIKKIEKELKKELYSYIELDETTNKYLNQFKPKYGDIILLLKANNVFYPDFFNTTPNKGMHGYLNHYAGQQGTMIHATSKQENCILDNNTIKLSEMKNYILSLWD
jgi:hypothetical protein